MASTDRFASPILTYTDILKVPATWPTREPELGPPPSAFWWGALLVVGIALRVAAMLQPWSLWHDEACLALNLQRRPALELVTRPLDFNQAAPPGFLLLSQFARKTLGESERALRFVPGVGGVLALLMFAVLARQLLAPRAALLALALFALAPDVVAAASELKQYSTDAAVAVGLTLLALPLLRGEWSGRRLSALTLAAVVAVWCSHPVVFVLGGLGLALTAEGVARRRWAELPGLFVAGGFWLASFGACWWICLRGTAANGYLRDYWAGNFAPLPPLGVGDWAWLTQHFTALFEHPLGLGTAELSLSGLGVLAFLIGVWSLGGRTPAALIGLLAPLALALLASGMKLYPFYGRLMLFAAPALALVTAAGAEILLARLAGARPAFGRLALAVLLLPPLVGLSHHFRERAHAEEVSPLLEQVAKHWRACDRLYVYYGAIPAYEFYGPRCGFPPKAVIEGVSSRDDRTRYLADLDRLSGRKRVWVLFAHRHGDEEQFFREHLDRRGVCRDALTAPGAAAYLYDLSKPSAGE